MPVRSRGVRLQSFGPELADQSVHRLGAGGDDFFAGGARLEGVADCQHLVLVILAKSSGLGLLFCHVRDYSIQAEA